MSAFSAQILLGMAPSMPSGALGIWYMDQYSSTEKATPNVLDAGAKSSNLFRASRRLFNNIEFWGKVSTTVVDASSTAPDASSDASTLSGTGNWYIGPSNNGTLAAGTYTIACNAKRNAGSDQVFAFSGNNTGTRSSVKTATSSWQRFSYTFTEGAPFTINRCKLCSSDGATDASLIICDLELYAGSSDLGPWPLTSHIYWGGSYADTKPSYSAGEMDLGTSGGWGVMQFTSDQAMSAITVIGVVAKNASGSSYHGMLSKVQTYTDFTAYAELTKRPEFDFSTTSAKSQAAGLWEMQSQGYHVLTLRQTGTATDIFLNESKVLTEAGTPSSVTLRDLYVGSVNGITGKHKFSALALYGRSLSDAEVRQAVGVLRSRAALSSLTVLTERVYCAEGDSISGASASCFPYLFGANASPVVQGVNYAISGSTLANLTSRATTVDGIIPPNKGSKKYILSVLIGANDLSGYSSAANYITDLRTYCAARRAAGWLVVVCTILPIDGGTTHNSRRATVNTDITTNFVSGGYADAIADLAADATMGPDNSRTLDGTKWTDATHPSAAGHALLEPYLRTAVNGL